MAGTDVTWGLLDALSRAVDVLPMDVEGREALRLGMSPEARCVCLVESGRVGAKAGAGAGARNALGERPD